MSTLAEIDEAVTTLRVAGAGPLALLKCCSAYPAAPEDMRLSTISNLAEAFGVPVGLSDHTLGIAVPVAAVALGACIIEKHFTLSRETDSPDKDFSLLPDEFADMVKAVRMTEGSLGPTAYGPTESEKASLVFRRSLFVTTAMAAGEEFSERNLRCIRPGYGMHSRYLEHVLGKRASRRIEAGTPLIWDLVS
jgi:sialic acid synthase SpsE